MILNGKPTKQMPEITKNELKHIRLLRQKKYRQQFGEFVVEGEKNVDELINSALEIKLLFATQDWDSINYEGEITTLSNKQLAQLSNLSTPNKVVALAKIPNFELDNNCFKEGLTLALDEINDPGNLGTLIRSADWFGVKNILCSINSVDCFNPKVVQSTKGSIANVKVHYVNLNETLSQADVPIYGADMEGTKVGKEFSFESPAVLLMGSESHGISDELGKLLTKKITIPRTGKAESLNVAIATSILLHHFNS